MKMQKEFVPYTLALELKELGFNESCFGVYSEFHKTRVYEEQYIIEGLKLPAPTFSQAFRWFREKYDLNHEISYAGKKGEYHAFVCDYVYGNNGNSPSVFSYEEAELACLIKLIQIIKDGNK